MAEEIVEEFLVESREGLDRVERDLVTLEQDPAAGEVVDRIFRDVHTIKGVCGFLAFNNLERVAHAAENVLGKIRANELVVSKQVIGALLGTVDAIRRMLELIERTESDGDEPYAELVAQLTSMIEPAPEASAPAGDQPSSVRPLGEVLVAQGVPQQAIDDAIRAQEEGDPRRIGEILVRRGSVRPKDVADALDVQDQARQDILSAKDATIRVSVDLLDKLMNLVGELVLVRNQILQTTLDTNDVVAGNNAQRLNLVTTELQEGVMKTRMQPIGTVWGKLPRVVRDLASACGKRVRLELEGRDTELDKTIIEAIKDPLTHLVRNACDHGLETPAERTSAGKPAEGVLRLRAYHEGGQVIIEVSDDGRGIDAGKVREKAFKKGFLTPGQASAMGEREALNLAFLPGLSTAEKVTNVSGRGVGMDVVKTNIEHIGGTIDLNSSVGVQTTIRVKIPLTLAIIPALVVGCKGDNYAIPQVSLVELVLLRGDERDRVEHVNGTPVYRLRGKLLPIVFLSEQLGLGEGEMAGQGDVNIVVLQADGRQFGVVVDEVRDTEEIVVKPLGKELKGLGAYAGATIMGDGAVALILDVLGLAQRARIVSEKGQGVVEDAQVSEESATVEAESLLLFDAIQGAPVAIPLARIDRLEEFASARVQTLGMRDVVQYRGMIMPIVHLGQAVYGVPLAEARQGDTWQVVVIRCGETVLGLVVDRLVDILDARFELRPVGRRHGILGTGIVQGRVVEMLDVDTILATAVPELTEGQSWSEAS